MSVPYAGPPQGHYPPPPRRQHRNSHTGLIVLAIVGGVIFVMFASCVALVASTGGGQGGPVAASAPAQSADPPSREPDGSGDPADAADQGGERQAKVAKVGDAVKVGNLEITVTKVRAGLTSIGPAVFDQHPDGQYVVVHLSVTNVGGQPEFFNSSGPAVYDDKGRKHNSTSVILGEQGGELFGEINPGNTTKGRLVFDIPKNARSDRLELSGGFFAEPVTVKL